MINILRAQMKKKYWNARKQKHHNRNEECHWLAQQQLGHGQG